MAFYNASLAGGGSSVEIDGVAYDDGGELKLERALDIDVLSTISLPYKFYRGCACIYNNKVHIVGGDGDSSLYKFYRLDNTVWTSIGSLPYQFYGGRVAITSQGIHMLGGFYSTYKLFYRWNGSSWQSLGSLPIQFVEAGVAVINDEIHIFGTGYTTTSSEFTAHYKWNGSKWIMIGTLPRYGPARAVYYKGEVHILGCYSRTAESTQHYKWNLSTWTKVGDIESTVQGYPPEFVILDDELYYLCNYLWKYNGTGWTKLKGFPYPLSCTSAVPYDESIYLIGGGPDIYQNRFTSILPKVYRISE